MIQDFRHLLEDVKRTDDALIVLERHKVGVGKDYARLKVFLERQRERYISYLSEFKEILD